MVCIDYFYDTVVGRLKRGCDADALVDLDRDGLLGHPAVLVLEDLERRFGVAFQRRLVQDCA